MEEVAHLRKLSTIRTQCRKVYELGLTNKLKHFTMDLSALSAALRFVNELIDRDYKQLDDIPPHSRWRHYQLGGRDYLAEFLATLKVDKQEKARALVDLFFVSVLLDAGAGDKWQFNLDNKLKIGRSEGLALAALEMFKQGIFSSDANRPHKVDAEGLAKLTEQSLGAGLQVSEENPLVGLAGRLGLLQKLGLALSHKVFSTSAYALEAPRPGHLVDFLTSHPTSTSTSIQLNLLWDQVMMDALTSIWPARLVLHGQSLGDVWVSDDLTGSTQAQSMIPFHKLSQWLTYSLIEALEKTLEVTIVGVEEMTGLPEYRNGGLFVDTGVLKLRPEAQQRGLELATKLPGKDHTPAFPADDPVIVEWRALTVVLLDLLAEKLREKLQIPDLALAKVLEAGTWKAGREIAAQLRPHTKAPPIRVISDGTVF